MSTKGRQNPKTEVESKNSKPSTSNSENSQTSSKESEKHTSSKSSTSEAYQHTIRGQLKLKGVVLKTTGKRKREWTPVKIAAEQVKPKTHEELLDERVKKKHDKFC